MQDLQMLFGGGGGGGGGERRLKTHNQQALKCPRCDSLNTKFCYYNNYNLSQPRFFCKGCRRYWTNGGVLRNVPVGSGCRKNKRSKQKSSNGNPLPTSELKSSDSQNSSSDSSKTFTQTPFTLSEGTPTFFSPNQRSDPPLLDTSDHNVLSEMGTFGSLITSRSYQMSLGFMQKEDELNSLGFMGEVGYSRPSSHIGVAAAAVEEDWGLFDQSYFLNNYDQHSNYFP